MDPFSLQDRVAVVTGGTRGIGRSIAEHLARAGAKVVVSSRKEEACDEVVRAIEADGGTAMAVPCNVARKEGLENLVARTREAWSRIDVLVCNAATNPVYGPLHTVSDEAFDKIMGTNLKSVFWLCNMVIPDMAESRGGSVIVTSSIAGLRGNPNIGTYAISKAAECQLVRNLAVEWGPKSVRVNAIAPGLIKTDFARALWENETLRSRMEAQTPLRRIGEPDDVGAVAVFLASDASRFITGQTLVADGGVTIVDPM